MNLITRPREEPQVNLTSLIDVVLLLLVFFMVTTSFVRESSVTADASHQSVITAMDVAGKLGFTSISIATLQPSND